MRGAREAIQEPRQTPFGLRPLTSDFLHAGELLLGCSTRFQVRKDHLRLFRYEPGIQALVLRENAPRSMSSEPRRQADV